MLATAICLVALILAGWAIAKNYDAKVVLFATGIVLMYCALILGMPILSDKLSSGLSWVDPFKAIKDIFVKQYSNAGLIILTLFGFAAYMSHIGANDAVIRVMSRPLERIRSPYILVPLVFWMGTLLSIIIPSASSLAVILMATLYPVLRAAKMSPLTAAGVIATTATIVPTPLGGDNVVAARVLGFEHVVDYVFYHHAPITIPALIIMGVAHYFWQKFMDKKDGGTAGEIDESKLVTGKVAPTAYAIFPVLPLVLTIFFWLFFKKAKVGLVEITLFSFLLAFITEIIRSGDIRGKLKDANLFFKGMGEGFSKVVVLIVAASTMVKGLSSMGMIDMISSSLSDVQNAGTGLMFAFSGITALITFRHHGPHHLHQRFGQRRLLQLHRTHSADRRKGRDRSDHGRAPDAVHVEPHPRGLARGGRGHHRVGRRARQSAPRRQAHERAASDGLRRRPRHFADPLHVRGNFYDYVYARIHRRTAP